jgi:hopene-associated glycosyltransferase HpnB
MYMLTMLTIGLLSLAIWIYLLTLRGQFWRTDVRLEDIPYVGPWPTVAIIIPARNEADLIATVLTSLLAQDYAGEFRIYLVDDQSDDGTAAIAQEIAQAIGTDRLHIVTSQALPKDWTGKLWALHQGIIAATENHHPEYFLLTDADIRHDRSNLTNLVTKAMTSDRDLVSLMVRLRCDSFWERLLIPAFVFFFAKLYPFRQVNDPNSSTAAAAGGCSLVKSVAIAEIGGIASLQNALIDDCTLAAKIKHRGVKPHRIWLGLSQTTHSLRPYESLDSIWQMVARTAYTQLNYSPLLLLATVIGMYLVYLAAPIGMITALIYPSIPLLLVSVLTYALMTIAYLPTVRFYRIGMIYAFCLPAIGLMYSGMTIDSARQHWQGKGGKWKGRSY